jgi:hypothetical protein
MLRVLAETTTARHPDERSAPMAGPNDYDVCVEVSIRNYQGNGNLQLRETVTIPDCTFADMADILHGFHEMAEAVKAAKAKAAG